MTLKGEGKKNHCFPRGQSLDVSLCLPTQKQEKKLALLDSYGDCAPNTSAVETEQSYRNDTIKLFSSKLTIMKTILKLLWLLLMLNLSVLDLISRETAYFVVDDKTIFLPGDSGRRASCRAQETYFWRQIKSVGANPFVPSKG